MSRSMKVAGGMLAVLLLYFAGRLMLGGRGEDHPQIPVARAETIPTLDKVVPEKKPLKNGGRVLVRKSLAAPRPVFLTLKGRTEPSRSAIVSAAVAGVVSAAPVEPGAIVSKGDILCSLDSDGARAALDEARAALTAAKLDFDATRTLVDKGWKPAGALSAAQAELDRATAAFHGAEIELAKTQIRAPFPGFLEKRMTEVGDFLELGESCGQVVDLDPLIVKAEAEEKYAGALVSGARAKARISAKSTTTAEGTVRFVASTPNPETRGYLVETAFDNPGMKLPAGLLADVRVQIGTGEAHHVSPALVTYAKDGSPGVRYVGGGSTVEQANVEVVDSDSDGVWVTGLPTEALLVIEGQDNIRPGARVDPVFEDEST